MLARLASECRLRSPDRCRQSTRCQKGGDRVVRHRRRRRGQWRDDAVAGKSSRRSDSVRVRHRRGRGGVGSTRPSDRAVRRAGLRGASRGADVAAHRHAAAWFVAQHLRPTPLWSDYPLHATGRSPRRRPGAAGDHRPRLRPPRLLAADSQAEGRGGSGQSFSGTMRGRQGAARQRRRGPRAATPLRRETALFRPGSSRP